MHIAILRSSSSALVLCPLTYSLSAGRSADCLKCATKTTLQGTTKNKNTDTQREGGSEEGSEREHRTLREKESQTDRQTETNHTLCLRPDYTPDSPSEEHAT